MSSQYIDGGRLQQQNALVI
ncbi:hypothetical protein RDI58_000764 [Solanum bulbocastanum]|uniref:Uncharacterized protein n=1 Tax=Solanum bulbocastanum TaxID=147425 RepID=A0AAN8YPC7_SOLBU